MSKTEELWDVIVVGGGTAGLAAAVAAGRNGARTLLVERYGFLGGTPTAALVFPFMTSHYGDVQVNRGLFEEMVSRLVEMEGSLGPLRCPYEDDSTYGTGGHITHFDPEKLKFLAFQMTEEAGVELMLHSLFLGAEMGGRGPEGIRVANKSGMQTVRGKVIVDATGDADVVAACGAKYEIGEGGGGLAQPATLFFHLAEVDVPTVRRYVEEHPEEFVWRTFPIVDRPVPEGLQAVHVAGSGFLSLIRDATERGELRFGRNRITFFSGLREGHFAGNATRIPGVDATNAEDLTFAEVDGRRQVMSLLEFLRKRVPGFGRCYLMTTGTQVGIRESRRIAGEYTMTAEDVIEGRSFEDGVAKGAFPIDIHRMSDAKPERWTEVKGPYDIPYRSLIPVELDGVIVAGRCISATHEAIGAVRVMPICMSMGEAAGTAAAMAASAGVEPREVDVGCLREQLRVQGAVV